MSKARKAKFNFRINGRYPVFVDNTRLINLTGSNLQFLHNYRILFSAISLKSSLI